MIQATTTQSLLGCFCKLGDLQTQRSLCPPNTSLLCPFPKSVRKVLYCCKFRTKTLLFATCEFVVLITSSRSTILVSYLRKTEDRGRGRLDHRLIFVCILLTAMIYYCNPLYLLSMSFRKYIVGGSHFTSFRLHSLLLSCPSHSLPHLRNVPLQQINFADHGEDDSEHDVIAH